LESFSRLSKQNLKTEEKAILEGIDGLLPKSAEAFFAGRTSSASPLNCLRKPKKGDSVELVPPRITNRSGRRAADFFKFHLPAWL
jgi:hypothetical protein